MSKDMNMAPDQLARDQILDPAQSFIVQAPAGSGKTELLTQRYLLLLSHAQRGPEEVIAITFTRKAAAEMRARVLAALNRAMDPHPPANPHAEKTWNLARAALQTDKEKSWNILNNSQRLKITTIDSLCANLVQKMPVISSLGSPPQVEEDLSLLYQEAVQSLLRDMDQAPWQTEIGLLLRHLDNQLGWFERLLIEMLKKREQWLDVVSLASKQQQLREVLEYSLQAAALQIMHNLQKAFPLELEGELLSLLQFALDQRKAGEARYLSLAAMQDLEAISTWREVAEIMLKKEDNEWRKKLNVRNGFPAGETKAEKAEYKAIKDRMEAILEQLAKTEQPGFKHYEMFREALASIKKVQAVSYQDKQWQIVQALLVVLPVAVARLKELFAERATVDFNEISLAALQALGAEEEPTELALSLDYQIRHLLIDEFQDTSQLQFQLLKALTRGWEPYDGRSLFLVGDPMQSIYRFRQADVSLFIQAKNYGIGNLALEYVQLTANFRSDQAVIDWVNHHFADIFPLQDDMVKGAVSYRPSIATRQYTDSEVKFMLTETALEEASLICEKVQALLCQAPEDNIAILVRSRSHLQAILPVLQAAGINYQAVEIESITERQVIRDLLSLTYALCHLGDKLSWLAILRAPWCGLGLSDLSLIAQASKSCPVWQALQSHELLQTLSGPGQASLARIIPILAASIMQRDRLSPRQFLEITWWNLDGPRCLTEKIDLENAESFFTMIEALSDKGRLPEREVIEQHLRGLKAQVQVLSTAPVQIMTIHKAKGLEFDSVILPGIGKGERSDTAALLLWESYALPDGSHGLLMAPIKSRNEADEPIYNFIDDANKGRKQFESQRLLYVAVTRAKKRLYLFGQCYFSEKQQAPVPRSGSFLALLWPKVQTQQFAQSLNQTGSVMPKIMPASHLKLARLDPASSSLFKVFDTNIEPASLPKLFDQGSFVQKAIGTLVHRYLAEIANFGLDNWPISKLESLLGKLAQELSLMGVPESECTKAAEQVQTALIKILQDDTGRWILSEHQQAHSELALVHFDAGRCKKYIIDRTFVDQNNERWIIDYKTSEPKTGQDLQEFLQQQKAQYREQLESYAKILSDKKIQHLGLYFPLMSYLYKIE